MTVPWGGYDGVLFNNGSGVWSESGLKVFGWEAREGESGIIEGPFLNQPMLASSEFCSTFRGTVTFFRSVLTASAATTSEHVIFS